MRYTLLIKGFPYVLPSDRAVFLAESGCWIRGRRHWLASVTAGRSAGFLKWLWGGCCVSARFTRQPRPRRPEKIGTPTGVRGGTGRAEQSVKY
jgi:hypothetical protein